jgi:hypothetical protein
MPFEKGNKLAPKPFVKGQSGNPKGQPRKLATQLKIIGYTKAEAAKTIEAMLAMNLLELKEMFENPSATILEKTIAAALKRSLENGSLYSIDTLLSRTHGKPTEMVDVKQELTVTEIKADFGN